MFSSVLTNGDLSFQGSGKSHLVSQLSSALQRSVEILPLYHEMTSRDLLQIRLAASEGDSSSGVERKTTSFWRDSALVSAAKKGTFCVLDGIDRVDTHCLLPLSRLLTDGFVDLPNGERLCSHPDFRVVGLAFL